MSLSYNALTPILVKDPITDIESVSAYAVRSSGQAVSYKQYSSTSISNTAINFSCPPPSGGVIVSREINAIIPVRLTITGKVYTTNAVFVDPTSLVNQGHDALRAWPISGSLDSLRVGLNNDSVSIGLSELVHPLQRYGQTEDVRARSWSMTPNMYDSSCNYSDLIGTSRNPLNNFGESKQSEILPRGAAQFTVLPGTNVAVVPTVAGTVAECTLDALLCEGLLISPIYFGAAEDNRQGFYNLTSCDVDFNFMTTGHRMLSHNPGAVKVSGVNSIRTEITGVTMQFSGFATPFTYPQRAPLLTFKYITPNYLDSQRLSPQRPISYGYSDVVRYISSMGTLTYAQGAQPFVSNSIQINTIPERMYLFARPSRATLESRSDITDTYLALQNLSVQFQNSSVLLSTASQQQLYQINVKNGYAGSWAEFTGQLVYGSSFATPQYSCGGSVMCLKFGEDIQLQSDQSPSLTGQFMLQVNASFKNPNVGGQWDAIPFEMVIVLVSGGVFTITQLGAASHQIGLLSAQDVLNAQSMPGLRNDNELRGSGLMDTIGDFGAKVNQFLKDSKILSTLAPMIPLPGAGVAGKIAQNLGYGYTGGSVIGGCPGNDIIGGAMISKKDLRRSLATR